MTDAEALHAMLDRKEVLAARRDFLSFYMRMTGFLPPDHVRVLAKLLQAMEDDKVSRAMVFMPPRHAKTLLCTTLFPAWIMGRYPSAKLMSVVHTQRYGAKIGRNVRNLIRHPAWPFPEVTLAADSQSREQWSTPQGGEYNAFGATGGNQHGNPAEWLFMDDLVKGRKDAMSAHMREEVWETYKTDLLSRLQGRRKQLMVMTRWHLDDPPGRILPDNFDGSTGWYADRETGDKWYVLSMPAVSEHANDPMGRKIGDWLWPEHFGEAELGGARRRGGWMWSALFQQRPSPEEGLLFTPDLLNRYDPARLDITRMRIYGSSDYAVTEKGANAADPDYTVHMVWGVDPAWNVYLLDLWRGRETTERWIDQWGRLVKLWKPLTWFEEGGQIIKSVGPYITNYQRRNQAWTHRVQINSTTDKWARAQTLLGIASSGQLFLPDRAKWDRSKMDHLDAFEKELLQFPTGRHDDTVDTATLFARGLDRMIEGQEQGKTDLPHQDTLDDLWSRHDTTQPSEFYA